MFYLFHPINSHIEERKMLIEVDKNYDLVPRVWGLGLKVKMNSFIYVLLGLFFTVFNPMMEYHHYH